MARVICSQLRTLDRESNFVVYHRTTEYINREKGKGKRSQQEPPIHYARTHDEKLVRFFSFSCKHSLIVQRNAKNESNAYLCIEFDHCLLKQRLIIGVRHHQCDKLLNGNGLPSTNFNSLFNALDDLRKTQRVLQIGRASDGMRVMKSKQKPGKPESINHETTSSEMVLFQQVCFHETTRLVV